MKQRFLYLLFLPLLLVLTAVYAEGVALKFFQETLLSALVFTLFIILPESLILRCRIKSVSLFGTLWRSLLLNAVSCLAVLVVLSVTIAVARDPLIEGGIISFILFPFLIILATEIPMLHVLFRAVPLSWTGATILGLYLSIISLSVFIFLTFPYTLYCYDRLEEVILWSNPSLLDQASGRIYTIGSSHRGPYRDRHFSLGVYDVEKRQMTTLTKRNLPSIDLYRWDVEGDTCAFVHDEIGDQGDRGLSVVRLSDFEKLLELSTDQFSDVQINNGQGGIQDVAVSPNQKKLAIILYASEGFKFGGKRRLVIVDIASGKEIAKASSRPDTYYHQERNICWLADSRRVLFSSFDNESHRRGLYVFDLERGTSSWFADGNAPSLAVATDNILIRDPVGGLALLGSSGNPLARLDVPSLGPTGAVVSPLGNMIVAEIRTIMPGGRLVVFNKENPDIRHVLHSDVFYRVDWTTGGNKISNHGVQETQ